MSLKKGGRKERKRRKTGNPSRERKNPPISMRVYLSRYKRRSRGGERNLFFKKRAFFIYLRGCFLFPFFFNDHFRNNFFPLLTLYFNRHLGPFSLANYTGRRRRRRKQQFLENCFLTLATAKLPSRRIHVLFFYSCGFFSRNSNLCLLLLQKIQMIRNGATRH